MYIFIIILLRTMRERGLLRHSSLASCPNALSTALSLTIPSDFYKHVRRSGVESFVNAMLTHYRPTGPVRLVHVSLSLRARGTPKPHALSRFYSPADTQNYDDANAGGRQMDDNEASMYGDTVS